MAVCNEILMKCFVKLCENQKQYSCNDYSVTWFIFTVRSFKNYLFCAITPKSINISYNPQKLPDIVNNINLTFNTFPYFYFPTILDFYVLKNSARLSDKPNI